MDCCWATNSAASSTEKSKINCCHINKFDYWDLCILSTFLDYEKGLSLTLHKLLWNKRVRIIVFLSCQHVNRSLYTHKAAAAAADNGERERATKKRTRNINKYICYAIRWCIDMMVNARKFTWKSIDMDGDIIVIGSVILKPAFVLLLSHNNDITRWCYENKKLLLLCVVFCVCCSLSE